MASLQLLTLIALWCGSPINKSEAGKSIYNSNSEISIETVQKCRNKLLVCASGKFNLNNDNDMLKVQSCFFDQKLGQ